MHQQIPVTELACHFVSKMPADSLGCAVPMHDPMVPIHYAHPLIEPIQQSLVQTMIEPGQLEQRFIAVCIERGHGPPPLSLSD